MTSLLTVPMGDHKPRQVNYNFFSPPKCKAESYFQGLTEQTSLQGK